MSTTRKILNATAIQVLGKIATAVLSIIIIKYITSLESIPGMSGIPAEYKLIYTYLLFFGVVADFGLFTIAVREMAREPEEKTPFILGNFVGMRIISVCTMMIIAIGLVFLISAKNYTPLVQYGVAFAAITTVFTMLASTISSVLQVRLKMGIPTLAILVGKIIMAAYIITVVLYYKEIPYAFYHLLAGGILGSLVTYIVTHYYTKKVAPFRPLFNMDYWKIILKSSIPYGIAVILYTIYFKVDVMMLSFLRDKQEIAIYGFPSTMIEMLSVFAFYFVNAVLPSLSRAIKENKEKAEKIIRLSGTFMILMATPMAVGGFILARPIIELTMGTSFLSGNSVGEYGADMAFRLIIISFLFSFLGILFSHVLVACDAQKKLLKINAIGVSFNIITNLIFIPMYGFRAAAATTILSEMIILLFTYSVVKKIVNFNLDTGVFGKIFASSVVMGGAVYLLQNTTHIALTISIGAAVFFLMLLLLRVITKETLHMFMRPSGDTLP